MSVAITIQETVNEVDITVNQNVITVNVTRTTGSGGVESVNGDTGDVVLTTDNVAEGSTNLYFTVARVRSTILTGISFVSGSVITATDTVLSALGKLQKQISSIDLPYVLKIGDKAFQEINDPSHTFVLDDRWKDTLFNGTTDIILDDDADTFPLDSVISFHVYDTTALFNYTAGTDLRYLGTNASADIPIEVGDDCRLKKIGSGSIWELVISNKSTGGSVDPADLISTDADNALVLGLDNKLFVPEGTAPTGNKLEYYATFVYDPTNPTAPIVTEDKNDFGAISVAFDDAIGQILLTGSGVFSGNIYIEAPWILPTFIDYPETCATFKNDSDTILMNIYNNVFAINPDYFIQSAYPIWIKLTKFVTP